MKTPTTPVVVRADEVRPISTPEDRLPIVLLDVDGVLADFSGAVLSLAASITGRSYSLDAIHEYDFARALGLSAEQRDEVYRAISSRRGFCTDLAVLPGAVEGVARLRQIADVYIVTSPWNSNETWVHEREEWLYRHFDIVCRRVLHGSAKHLVGGDFLVDDKTETCRAWQAAHPNGIAVQWQTPHNRKDGWTGISTRSWAELCALVEGRRS